jgi:hypothetical protein
MLQFFLNGTRQGSWRQLVLPRSSALTTAAGRQWLGVARPRGWGSRRFQKLSCTNDAAANPDWQTATDD